jgi:hypothetical protein
MKNLIIVQAEFQPLLDKIATLKKVKANDWEKFFNFANQIKVEILKIQTIYKNIEEKLKSEDEDAKKDWEDFMSKECDLPKLPKVFSECEDLELTGKEFLILKEMPFEE